MLLCYLKISKNISFRVWIIAFAFNTYTEQLTFYKENKTYEMLTYKISKMLKRYL